MARFRWGYSVLVRTTRRLNNRIGLLGLLIVMGVIWSHYGAGDRPSSVMAQSRPDPIQAITWQQTAQLYRGQDQAQDQDHIFYCPGNGQLESIWGSDVYSAESSICTAAVHAGLITVENGGAIAIRLLPTQLQYLSTTQNDVTSAFEETGPFGAIRPSRTESLGTESSEAGSFTFTSLHDPIVGIVTVRGQSVPIQVISWDTTAEGYQKRQGDAIALYCPPSGELGLVWGTTQYLDISSICTAAVHANRIALTMGGAIAIEMAPNQSSYNGSTHQGVTSQTLGQAFNQPSSLNSSSFGFVPVE